MARVHVFHPDDLVDHVFHDDDCICGPDVDLVPAVDGSDGWLYTHHVIDLELVPDEVRGWECYIEGIGVARCWCGGEVAAREPGDELGLGCLANIYHDWRNEAQWVSP